MKCQGTTKSGKPCRLDAAPEPDPDGSFRCWNHSKGPAAEEKRAKAHAKARKGGIDGKRRHIETAKAVAAAQRAAGVVSRPTERRGVRGMDPLPEGVSVPKAGEELVIPPEVLGDREVKTPHRVRLAGYDLTNARGRHEMLSAVIEARDAGQIDSAEADVYIKAIKMAEGIKGGAEARRTVMVRFATITTREQAEAYKEAQLLREGAN